MRVARRKMRGKPCYYHLYNRTGGDLDSLPLTEPIKAYAGALVQDLARYFTLDIISYAWMGNHFHIVLYASGVAPDLETAANRHNAYYAKRGDNYNPVSHAPLLTKIANRMADISEFMKVLQQRVAVYWNPNRSRGRGGGHLWADRFKSSIIGLGKMPPGSIAAEARQEDQPGGVWRCVKYVELNPCRAGLTRDPGDYAYSTWGAFRQTGAHPFYRNFVQHMRSSLAGMAGAVIETWAGRQVFDEFSRQLTATLAQEAAEFAERQRLAEHQHLVQKELAHGARPAVPVLAASPPAGTPTSIFAEATPQAQYLEEPGRHWIDGGIVGSERFVRWVAGLFARPDDPPPKRLGESQEGGEPLATLYQLRQRKTPDPRALHQ